MVGREFTRSARSSISLRPAELAGIDGRLATLLRKGLIRAAAVARAARTTSSASTTSSSATSPTRGITKSQRADLHERHGQWLDQRDGLDEIIGYHFEQAHRYRAELRPADPALGRSRSEQATAWRRPGSARSSEPTCPPRSTCSGGRRRCWWTSRARAEALAELGIAQWWVGEIASGQQSLSAAIEAAATAQDRGLGAARSHRARPPAPLHGQGRRHARFVERAREAIPLFEQLADHRALGRAWRQIGYVRGALHGHCGEWLTASERALEHYRASGWSASGVLSELAAALFYGPTPVPEAVERCERLLAETTDRTSGAQLLVYLAGLRALAGRFDDALELMNESESILRELGETYAIANNSGRILGRIQLLAGDPQQAERTFRECCKTFEAAKDEAAFSTVAAQVGQALFEQGCHAEADEWGRLAEEHAPRDDIAAQFSWRSLRGKALATASRAAEGEALALEALQIVSGTDLLTHRGNVLLDLAEVLRGQDRQPEAGARIEEALALFARKADTASAVKAASSGGDRDRLNARKAPCGARRATPSRGLRVTERRRH